MPYPEMVPIRQKFEGAPRCDDIAGAVTQGMRRIGLADKVIPGMRIALTAGSRGVANISVILKAAADELKRLGAQPFIVPAMGSHGGGTAPGQVEMLEALGVTEASTGVPILASMDTVQVGTTESGIPVFQDKYATEADGIVIVARTKTHTGFEGPIESGLHKMMMIGLGKHRGAIVAHQHINVRGYNAVLPEICKVVLAKQNILCGISTIENALDETAEINVLRPEEFWDREVELLARSKQLMARLPFDDIDVLVVDEIGKQISGSGMDSKVIARVLTEIEASPTTPRIKRIYVRDLTPQTHGNAAGVGAADFIHRRAFQKINLKATYINCLTGGGPRGGMIPVIAESDSEAFEYAFSTLGPVEPEQVRVVHIRNTLLLERLACSVNMLDVVRSNPRLEVTGAPYPIQFDRSGDLTRDLRPVVAAAAG